jgi:hypothetical protein
MLDEIIQLFSKEVKGIINDLLNDGARIMKKDVEQICKIMNTDVETLIY